MTTGSDLCVFFLNASVSSQVTASQLTTRLNNSQTSQLLSVRVLVVPTQYE